MASTIDSGTKVQIGILCTLLAACSGGAWWAATMAADVSAVKDNSDKMTAATLRIEAVVQEHGRKFAGVEEVLKAIDKRLDVVEAKVLR